MVDVQEISQVIQALDRTLRVMQSANRLKTNMCIWDTDIEAVENAIRYLRKVRESE